MTGDLPELDIAGFLADPDTASSREFTEALRAACHEPGFCYLSGHGVSSAVDEAVLREADAFFRLPQTEKDALSIVKSPHFRGYTPLGSELTGGVSDWREQLDVGREEPAREPTAADPAWLRLRGPNQWPSALPRLRPAVLAWMTEMHGVALAILRGLSLSLGQDADYFDRFMLPRGDPHLKLMRYPAQDTAALGQGVGMHHDSGLLSFVLQGDVGGLQVQTDQRVLDVRPRAGSYIMNLGEMMQAVTDGYLRATKHRVVSPPIGPARISAAYFAHPALESRFEPMSLPAEFQAAAPGGQSTDPKDPIHACFGDNYLKIRLRAHPDVAHAHFHDL